MLDFATDMLSSAKMYMRQRNKRRGSDGSCLRYVLFVFHFYKKHASCYVKDT